MLYIYIHAKLNFLGSQKSMVLERFWIGFLEIMLISLSYYFAYHVGKDDGKRIQCDGRLSFVRKPSYRVGVWGREYAIIFFDSRLTDDVKRLQAMDVLVSCDSLC